MFRRSVLARSELAVASYDAIVSGGGMVGAAVMATLQQLRQRVSAAPQSAPAPTDDSTASPSVPSITSANSQLSRLLMVDASKRPTFDPSNMMHRLRTVSLTPVASKIIDNLGGWEKLTTKHSYYRIAVRHEQLSSPTISNESRSSSIFLRDLLGRKSTTKPLLEFTDLRKPVGYICFNTELNKAMVDVVEAQQGPNDVLQFESTLSQVQLPPKNTVDGPWGTAQLTTNGGQSSSVRFGLVLGCEGRGSPLRDVVATPSVQVDYAQTAFVCDVRLEKTDDGNVCCFQNFFRDGMIIAMLPTSEETANIVFSTSAAHAEELLHMPQTELVDELNARLCSFAPADIPRIVEVPEGEVNGRMMRARGKFPLKLNFVTTPYVPRALLVGDAAHGIHPFAGQGLNLGVYDVGALADVLEIAIKAGQDIGSSVAVGQPFAASMIAHTAPMITAMEAIKRLTYVVPGLSCLGMKALNEVPVLSTLGKDAILQVSSGAAYAALHPDCFLLR